MWVLIFSTNLSEKRFIPRKLQRDVITYLHESSPKVSTILVRILIKLESSRQVFEQHTNFKLHENPYSRTGVFFRAGRMRYVTKLTVVSRNFSNAQKRQQGILFGGET